jgi:predicted enzyme related to lactoylglutathione lyase
MFSRYSLRTIEIDGARRFYEEAIGLALPDGAAPHTSLEAWTLHERARSMGAPPHWLGQLEVDELGVALTDIIALGAQPLGPTVRAPDGAEWATLRDPFGAVIALRARRDAPPDRPVAWHQLHTNDLDRAWGIYTKLTGWRDAGAIDAADPEGGHRLFAWSGGAEGSVANTARWRGVHAHWLFYFPVADVEMSSSRVRALGGMAMAPMTLGGRRVAACEDPQGAAFGLIDRG